MKKGDFDLIRSKFAGNNDITRRSGIKGSCSLRIITVNDVYQIDHIANYATCKKQESVGADLTIGTLPGDFVAPSLLSSLDKGVGIVDCMLEAGIDYVCFGNHENDIPIDQLYNRIKQKGSDGQHITWINSNMRDMPHLMNPSSYRIETPPYKIIKVYGGGGKHIRKVALIGLCTEDPHIKKHNAFGGATISPLKDTALQLYNHLITVEKVDLVIPLTHQLVELDRELAAATQGFRIILGGHDHEEYLENVDFATGQLFSVLSSKELKQTSPGCAIVKTGMDAKTFGICDIVWDEAGDGVVPKVSVVFKEAAAYAPDVELQSMINKHTKVLKELEASILFTIPEGVTLTSKNMRNRPTSVGTLFSNIVRDVLVTDCVLFGGGCIRGNQDYPSGYRFSFADVKNEFSLGAEMVVVHLSGQCIKDSIEYTRAKADANEGGYLQTDDSISWDKDTNTVTKIAGEDVDLTKLYTVGIMQLDLTGLDNILPLIKYVNENHEKALRQADSGIDATLIVIDYFSKRIWFEILSQFTFDEIDKDHNGYITKDEVSAVAHNKFGKSQRDATDIMVDNLFAVADTDKDGRITRNDVVLLSHVSNMHKLNVQV